MASKIAPIADAIVSVLTAARAADPPTLSLDFVISRKFIPAAGESQLKDLTLTVIPSSADLNQISRTTQTKDIKFDIGVEKKLSPLAKPEDGDANTAAEIDPLLQLAEEVSELWTPRTQFGATTAHWLNTKHTVIYDVDTLRNNRIFLSVITITVKI